MRSWLRWFAVLGALAVVPAVACGGDDDDNGTGPGGITLADLTGTWDATQVEFVDLSNPLFRVDMVALGGSLVLTVEANGDYTATVEFPGEQPETETGTVTLSGNVVELNVDGVPESVEFDITLVGNTLTMVTESEEFDFDGDGTDEPARLTIVLVRRS